MADRHDGLARQLAIAFAVLVVYASLHPFSGWRDLGAPPFAWLTTAWLRYSTGLDITFNILGYLPLGFLWATVLRKWLGRWLAIPAAALLGAVLSGSMETVQNYLPTRVPSNLDLTCNTAGALLGAIMGASWGGTLLSGGRLIALRERHIVPGYIGDSGLVLMGFWLLTQINPESLLFGNGDLRRALGIEPTLPFDVERFSHIEAAIAGANVFAVGLVLAQLGLKNGGIRTRGIFAILLLGMGIRALAAAIMVAPSDSLHWITSGNTIGLTIGSVLLLVAMRFPPSVRRVLAAMSLLLASVLVNVAPQNPYLAEAALVWRGGHFLNFSGLTRLLSMVWPFLALAWLLLPERNPWKSNQYQ